ncbi:CCA tRNA nucleotidyltransferase [Aerococcaceae bacterium DSM 111020]|nr:CCA tRNA nucleotidyltransferase [Aerococcaceae bacterium DSM 111020]
MIDLSEPLFQQALPLLTIIESHGHEAYFVGGSVRDFLLGKTIHDIDIATSATPQEIKAIFPATIDVGIEHGTVIVRYKGGTYEVTTFRVEGKYSDYRRPDRVDFVRNLEQDTLRRDFTINALAIDSKGHVFDYHGGLKDLKCHLIRAVGNPHERFQEDALRMLRALRFSTQLGFTIDKNTMSAIQQLAFLIENIAMERIQIEFTKYLQGHFFSKKGFSLIQSELYHYLPFPNDLNIDQLITSLEKDFEPIETIKLSNHEILVWGSLLYHLDIQTRELEQSYLRKWKHSNALINNAIAFKECRRLDIDELVMPENLYRFDRDILTLIETFYLRHGRLSSTRITEAYLRLQIKNIQELAINGKQIMAILELERGGPIVGKLLADIERKVVTGSLNNEYDEIVQYINEKMH